MNKLENNKKACARATVAEGQPLSLIINKTTSFSFKVRGCGGYDLSTGGDNVTATLTCDVTSGESGLAKMGHVHL